MKTYGIEDRQGYNYEQVEDSYRKSRARQRNKQIIQRQYKEYLISREKAEKIAIWRRRLNNWCKKNQ